MIPRDCSPISHRPPMPRVETSPRYTPAPWDGLPDHVRDQIEHMQQMIRNKEGERLWELVVQSARGG